MSSTRRGFLAGLAGGGLGAALGPPSVAQAQMTTGVAGRAGESVPFFGARQAGISTPSQEHVQFASFDMVRDSLGELRGLLRTWSRAAALISRGEPVGEMRAPHSPPADTGESAGRSPARVTVTFGLGPGVFGRFGLAGQRPAALVDLPRFSTDRLEPHLCGGDLAVQVCSDDPQVAFHALHDLTRLGQPIARPRWLLSGFGPTGNVHSQPTPRNLMGFKDGTANPGSEDTAALDQFVWASGPESPSWMHGGSYMVVRRIEILRAGWDASTLHQQQDAVGRHKLSGAPLTGEHEYDPLDLGAQRNGSLVIPWDAHVRLASPGYNHGQRILRRGYSYVDGLDQATGSPAGGQLFICYQRDPRAQFIPIQRRLAAYDALSRHTRHVGSAIFACPPGATPGGYVGEGLLG
jgi:deferrochelatase/peroxidase EfeB